MAPGPVFAGWRLAVNFLALVALAVVVLVLQFVAPFQRGFFCNDETIIYPLKPSTITTTVLIIVCVFAPLALMLLGTAWLSRRKDWKSPKCSIESFGGRTHRLAPYIIHFVQFFFVFILGGVISQLVTDVGKLTIGRLRPNFVSVCKPDYSAINCTDSFGRYQYVTGDFCTGEKKVIDESRKSWPSGHASASTYAMVYALLYIEYCYFFRRLPAVRSFVNLVFIFFAFCTILSRIDDNKHHWSDVLSGALIGASVAIAIFWRNFSLEDRAQYLDAHATPVGKLHPRGDVEDGSVPDPTM